MDYIDKIKENTKYLLEHFIKLSNSNINIKKSLYYFLFSDIIVIKENIDFNDINMFDIYQNYSIVIDNYFAETMNSISTQSTNINVYEQIKSASINNVKNIKLKIKECDEHINILKNIYLSHISTTYFPTKNDSTNKLKFENKKTLLIDGYPNYAFILGEAFIRYIYILTHYKIDNNTDFQYISNLYQTDNFYNCDCINNYIDENNNIKNFTDIYYLSKYWIFLKFISFVFFKKADYELLFNSDELKKYINLLIKINETNVTKSKTKKNRAKDKAKKREGTKGIRNIFKRGGTKKYIGGELPSNIYEEIKNNMTNEQKKQLLEKLGKTLNGENEDENNNEDKNISNVMYALFNPKNKISSGSNISTEAKIIIELFSKCYVTFKNEIVTLYSIFFNRFTNNIRSYFIKELEIKYGSNVNNQQVKQTIRDTKATDITLQNPFGINVLSFSKIINVNKSDKITDIRHAITKLTNNNLKLSFINISELLLNENNYNDLNIFSGNFKYNLSIILFHLYILKKNIYQEYLKQILVFFKIDEKNISNNNKNSKNKKKNSNTNRNKKSTLKQKQKSKSTPKTNINNSFSIIEEKIEQNKSNMSAYLKHKNELDKLKKKYLLIKLAKNNNSK